MYEQIDRCCQPHVGNVTRKHRLQTLSASLVERAARMHAPKLKRGFGDAKAGEAFADLVPRVDEVAQEMRSKRQKVQESRESTADRLGGEQ